jgi:thiaminase/transcriptional activator TenA
LNDIVPDGRYLREFGIDPAGIADTEPSPDCLAYASYLIAAAYHDPWEVLVTALLPCLWLYWDVGCAIARVASPQNPYKASIDTYADERFGDSVRTVIAIADRAAEATTAAARAKMLAAFARACQYEWLFWDGAYQRRSHFELVVSSRYRYISSCRSADIPGIHWLR